MGNLAKSATSLLLPKTYEETWYRGEEYADKKLVDLKKFDHKVALGIVHGTKRYEVRLAFTGNGISRSCSCPYVGGDVCKHMAALAMVWDEIRGMARPTKAHVAAESIAPPLVSQAQINALYKNPLEADLEVLRVASSETGRWSRPHARLLARPPFVSDTKKSLTLDEVKKALREIRRWSRKSNYDPYFCAGEMMAAFCDIVRLIFKRAFASDEQMLGEILLEAQSFYTELVYELIDDSDGLHEFGQAHLDELYRVLDGRAKKLPAYLRERVQKQLKIFDERADD